MIEKMKIEHIEEVAKIHVNSWAPYEVSVKLGKEYLTKCFYGAIVNSPLAFGYVYIDDGKLIAYATGFHKYLEFNRDILGKYLFYLSSLILRKLFSHKLSLADIFDMLRDSRKLRKLEFPEYHLGSLALSNEYKKTAKGKEAIIRTIERVLLELEENGCGGYWGACDDRNKPMQKILQNLGFRQVDVIPYCTKVITVYERNLSHQSDIRTNG